MSGFCSGCGKDVAVEDVRCFCEACASKRAESAPSAAPNKRMAAATWKYLAPVLLGDIANLICERDKGNLSYSELVVAIEQRLNDAVASLRHS